MKRLLVLFLLFIPISLFAQFQVIDFETVGQNWTFHVFANGPGDSGYTVAANPSIGGINTSANCGKFVVQAIADPWAGFWTDDIPEFTLNASNSTITIMVYKDVISNFNLKLEAPGGGGWAHDNNVPNTLINQWEMLTFDYSADIGQTVGRMTIIPDFPATRTAGSTNYFDNIDFGTTVPVELTSFTGAFVGSDVQLKWATATELNNRGFEIQKSVNGSTFATIAFVEGFGTTSETKQYSFTDRNVAARINVAYRLKQIDFNGTYDYSKVVNLGYTLPLEFALEQNYPNPFNPTTNIVYSVPVKSTVSLDVYNLIGQKVVTLFDGEVEAGKHSAQLDASSMSSGMYFFKLTAVGENGTQFTSSKKMTLLK